MDTDTPGPIEAEGFRLRPLSADDWPLVEAAGHTDVPDWTFLPRHVDERSARAWTRRDITLRDRGLMRFVIEVDGAGAGMVGGRHDPPGDPGTIEVFYFVMPEFRRLGLATRAVAAFEDWARSTTPELRRFQLHVIAGNPGSAEVARRAGYTFEGRSALRIPPVNGHPARDADLFAKVER